MRFTAIVGVLFIFAAMLASSSDDEQDLVLGLPTLDIMDN
jgi:hypothetical protein